MGDYTLQIEYEDEDLRRMSERCDYRSSRWDTGVVRAYRKTIQLLDSVRDPQDLAALRSARLRHLGGPGSGRWSIRVTGTVQLALEFRATAADPVVHVHQLLINTTGDYRKEVPR